MIVVRASAALMAMGHQSLYVGKMKTPPVKSAASSVM
jgi:hypothetical protein